MGSSYLKTCMFVFVLGVNKDTIFVIYDTILCLFIELCFMCASLFFFLSHKSLHGQIEATARLVCVSLYLKDSMFYMVQCFVCLVLQLQISTVLCVCIVFGYVCPFVIYLLPYISIC